MPDDCLTTPLDALHRELGARMVSFAAYSMPLHYTAGVLAEHLGCRGGAALFDVSHMGQAVLRGPDAVAAIERLTPADIAGLPVGRQRYALLTDTTGGILDDLMASRIGQDALFLVVNAARKSFDFAHIAAHLPPGTMLEPQDDYALLALQGPRAEMVLLRLAPAVAALRFMHVRDIEISGVGICRVSRSGYTGEDGFEISVPSAQAEGLARRLLSETEVIPAGLGARDSLRLEAGLPLYGADLDSSVSPVEAGLSFAIGQRRRQDWSFVGSTAIRSQLEVGTARRLVGIRPAGRALARGGTVIAAPRDDTPGKTDPGGATLGTVTSGGFGPSVDGPICMGFIRSSHATPGTPVALAVRGRMLPARIESLPFVPHRYAR